METQVWLIEEKLIIKFSAGPTTVSKCRCSIYMVPRCFSRYSLTKDTFTQNLVISSPFGLSTGCLCCVLYWDVNAFNRVRSIIERDYDFDTQIRPGAIEMVPPSNERSCASKRGRKRERTKKASIRTSIMLSVFGPVCGGLGVRRKRS